MTPGELKQQHEAQHPDNHYFDRESMQFWGDTMSNYKVTDAGIVEGYREELADCWELSRRKPVKGGLQTSDFFTKDDFRVLNKG